jgi:uncharacterized lipoprotein YehR (DUF1307 family)
MKRFALLLLAVFMVLSAAIAFAGGGDEEPTKTLCRGSSAGFR